MTWKMAVAGDGGGDMGGQNGGKPGWRKSRWQMRSLTLSLNKTRHTGYNKTTTVPDSLSVDASGTWNYSVESPQGANTGIQPGQRQRHV